jgi:DNA ligase-1
MTFRPNLAAKLKPGQTYEKELAKLPLSEGFLVSPKLDGIRCIMHPKLGPITRSGKQIPNRALHHFFLDNFSFVSGFDGEFVWGDHESPDYSFQKTFSKFSTEDDADISQMCYHVFDDITDQNKKFLERAFRYTQRITEMIHGQGPQLLTVPQTSVYSITNVLAIESYDLSQNYEGVMLRHPSRPYKMGRSTWKEAGLIALKRTLDAEAEIIGVEELFHNDNEQTTNELGYAARSSHQANKTPAGTLGALLVSGVSDSPFAGIEFKIGGGFTDSQRKDLWLRQRSLPGQIVTFKYQPVGVKEKPRAPIFKSFRND